MLLELTTIACPPLEVDGVTRRAREWTAAMPADATTLGFWRTEIGTLGRILVLRGFDTAESLACERERALASPHPFHLAHETASISMETHAPFDFLPRVAPGARGKVYEFRTYRLKPGGLAPTREGWRRAIGPARDYTAHLVTAMHALDGAPRITHIWAFDDLAQRARLRSHAYAASVWPPPGGPEQIVKATSTIALPEPFSPLH